MHYSESKCCGGKLRRDQIRGFSEEVLDPDYRAKQDANAAINAQAEASFTSLAKTMGSIFGAIMLYAWVRP